MGSEQINEDEIAFKKRARRRLVGAIALVLLMVTVLPMVLDDRNNQSTKPEIEITIPSETNLKDSEAFAHKSITTHPSTPSAGDVSTAHSTPEPAPTEASANEVNVNNEIAQAKQAQQSHNLEQSAPSATSIQPHVEPTHTENVLSKHVQPNEKMNAVNSDSNKNAEKQSETATIAVSKPVDNKPSETKQAETKQAETKQAETKQAEKKSETPSSTNAGNVWVQVGVFSNEQKVHELQTKLLTKGIHTTIEPLETAKGKSFRLKTESYSQRDQAEKAITVLKGEGIVGMIKSK